MADFVAVIRRAVDGLSENTPEMRVKVYERARGAVQRQLENMKPRPPEDMLRRQLDKLDAAIREVEREHSEALAPEGVAVATASVVAHEVHAPEPEIVPAEPAAAPAEPEVVQAETYAQPAEHPADQAPAYEPDPEPEQEVARVEPAQAYEAEAPFVEHEVHPAEAPPHEEPAAPVVAEEWHQPADEDVAEPWHTADAERKPEETHEDWADRAEPIVTHRDDIDETAPEEWPQQTPATFKYAVDEDQARARELLPDAAVEGERFVEEVRAEPISADGAGQFTQAWPEAVRSGEAAAKMPSAVEAFSWDANAFDELPPFPPPKPAKPAKPVPLDNFDDVDLFADVHGAPAALAPKDDTPGEAWRELKELADYDTAVSENGGDRATIPPDLDQAMVQKLQGKSFRLEPKRKRVSLGKALIAIAALALVAGGSYLVWLNREALNGMVTGLVTSAPKTATVADKPKLTEEQQTEAAKTPTPSSAGPAAAQKPAGNGTDVASAAGAESVVNNKFTQRLLANGNEVDDGPAAVPGQAVAEGKSVAEQNVAAAAPSAAAPVASDAPAAATPTPNSPSSVPPAAQPSTAQQAAAIGTPEKMFLYEERLGQTSPTAIEGTVTWSVQEEKGEDGRPQPTVQGNITVPERGLTAIVTFKRNTDASLPASHLVELVFSVPPNFEGGAIESVQRIAMKATEQDRGDALIAVPAKITDDFHMVALNDFPDARKTNLDLLKSRGWIDIPITYRNGRRALLTLSKGTTGNDAFNKVIGQWAAQGDVSSSQ